MLVVIPIMSFLIPIVFFNIRFQRPPYYSLKMYLVTFLITVVNWTGSRFIMVWARTRYPHFEEIRKRLFRQSLVIFLYAIVATNVLGFLLRGYCVDGSGWNSAGITLIDVIINSNSAAFFCTLTVVAIYESKYYVSELKNSIEEKELLKRVSLQAQLNALKTQVNPHFLFNNLNTLCSIIPDEPKKAVDFVQQLSRVYRHILEVKDATCIPLREELEVLKSYVFLLKTRFGDSLEVNITVSDDELEHKIVPLSLQLLLENAINHNIVSADKPLKIEICTHNGNLIVTNNLQKKNQVIESTGIGLNNIRNRYKILTEKPVAIIETGSVFTVSIPLIDD
jgi:two-component system LytT family sensor kinase